MLKQEMKKTVACANSRLKGKWRRSALTWLLPILLCSQAFGAEFDAEFNAELNARLKAVVKAAERPPSNVLEKDSTIPEVKTMETLLALREGGFNHEGSQEMEYDPYLILGISHKASLDEATAAYRHLISHWHPDRNRSPEATAVSALIHKAYEKVKEDLKSRGEKTDILHTAIQSALIAIAAGRQSAEEIDRDLKNTLEILLEYPQIKRFINDVMAGDPSSLKPVYRKRATPLQMALYLPDSAAFLLENGADASASGPDLLPPVEQALSRRTDFYPAHSLRELNNDVNFDVFNLLLNHGKIDLSGISADGQTVLETIMIIAAGSLNISMGQRREAERMREQAQRRNGVCPSNDFCAPRVDALYCSSCDSKRRGERWKNLFFQLLNEGADLNLKNDKGQAILHRAIDFRNKEIINHLIDRFGTSIDWEYTDNKGRTYLDIAITSGDEVLALKIIKIAGADMSHRNPKGETYLESALRANFRKLSLFIAQNGGFESVRPNERTRFIAYAARDLNHHFLKEMTPSLGVDEPPLLITGESTPAQAETETETETEAVVVVEMVEVEVKMRAAGKGTAEFKRGSTMGRWGMIAGAAAGAGFSALNGIAGFDMLFSATFGAMALGLPLVLVNNCRSLFSHLENKSASKFPKQD